MPPKSSTSASSNKLWIAVGAAASAVGLGYLAYRFFSKPASLDVKSLVVILTDIARSWQEIVESMEDMRREIEENSRKLPPAEVRAMQKAFMEAARQRVEEREIEICKEAGVSKEQLNAAVEEHQSDPAVAFLLQTLAQAYSGQDDDEEVDESSLPSLEVTVKVMATVLELSIVVMEEVHRQVTAKLDPEAAKAGKHPKLTPQFVSTLNTTYGEQFLRVRQEVFNRMNVDERIITAASVKYQNEPEFLDMLRKHTAEKTKRFRALGLAQASPSAADDDDE